MDTTLSRSVALPATPRPAGRGSQLLRLFAALAYRAAERLPSPQREVPPEFYRFPPV